MTIGSLFSGIGGLELGLERAGLGPTLWQVELDSFCRKVLEKHWPHATRFEDVRCVDETTLVPVDVICGGFPCQGNSSAGKREGLNDPRSALWFQFARIIDRMRPRVVVIENVASGAKLWLPTVKEDLFRLDYRACAYSLSAYDVGAPHLRRRIFVVAYADSDCVRKQSRRRGRPNGNGPHGAAHDGKARTPRDTNGHRKSTQSEHEKMARMPSMGSDASAWSVAPQFRGVADGIPDRLERLRALGNAVVPQCAEVIGRIIKEAEIAHT